MSAISTEYSDMKVDGMGSSALPQAYMFGMNEMHKKMMVVVKESDSDRASAKDMIIYYEGIIATTETELKYGKDPEMRKLTEDIIKAQKGEIDQMNKWPDNQK